MQEVKKAASTIGNAFKNTEKQQELLYEKIKQKKEQLADLKSRGISSNATDEEIKAKMKEIGKIPDLVDKNNIVALEAEIERLENKLTSLQKGSGTIFDPEDVSELKTHFHDVAEETQRAGSVLEEYHREMEKINSKVNPAYSGTKSGNSPPDAEINQRTEVQPSQTSMSLWDRLKEKIQQVKPAIQQFKQLLNGTSSSKELEFTKYKISEIQEKLEQCKAGEIKLSYKEILQAETELEKLNNKKTKLEIGGKQNVFSNMFSSLKKMTPQLSGISSITIKIKNQIKQMSSGMKQGLGHVAKYAGALFSLRSIYSALSSSASSWLSSQNSQAQQLSANIEYMKYAMGSVFAPVIEYVTNLIYNLMKAIQNLVYAFSGVNIFAKATASSMKSTASSAKQANKSLSSVHSEINNVSNNDNSGSGSGSINPNIDLSKIDNAPNSIVETIKNGNWYEIGATIGQKLNEAMERIPWDRIKNTAKKIGGNIANFLNGFIAETKWEDVGKTFAEGLNTVIYLGHEFITTFNWENLGKAIAGFINGSLKNADWSTAGKTFGECLEGVFTTAYTTIEEIDWQEMARSAENYISNIDWGGVVGALFRSIGSIFGALWRMIVTWFTDAVEEKKQYFLEKTKECGGNIILGVKKGIEDELKDAWQWVKDHIFKPFIDGFKNAFGIHSPSTVMEEQGHYIIEGLKNGMSNIWENVGTIFSNLVSKVKDKFEEIRNNIQNWAENTKKIVRNWADTAKTKISECWNNISSNVKDKISTIKDTISTGLNNAKTTISSWADTAKSKISECWNNISNTVKEKVGILKDNISTGLNNAKNTIGSWGDNIKNSIGSTFSNVVSKASTWGKDLVTNMSSGIKNNISKVTSAVNSVASKIKSLLGFSEPEEGPLSNFHTYMPDMIDLMVSGIKGNMSKVTQELENLTGQMSYTINTPNILPLSLETILQANELQPSNVMIESLSNILANNGQDVNISIPLSIYVGKEKLGDILLADLRNKKRQTGKGIDALVGG